MKQSGLLQIIGGSVLWLQVDILRVVGYPGAHLVCYADYTLVFAEGTIQLAELGFSRVVVAKVEELGLRRAP